MAKKLKSHWTSLKSSILHFVIIYVCYNLWFSNFTTDEDEIYPWGQITPGWETLVQTDIADVTPKTNVNMQATMKSLKGKSDFAQRQMFASLFRKLALNNSGRDEILAGHITWAYAKSRKIISQ